MEQNNTAHTIELFISNGSWMARHSDPAIAELFGTNVLPTCFTDKADPESVLLEVQSRNRAHVTISR